MTEERWVIERVQDRILYREKRPFKRCPNCQQYDYTTRKKTIQQPGLIFGRNRKWKYKYYEYCHNCELKHNEREVVDDG